MARTSGSRKIPGSNRCRVGDGDNDRVIAELYDRIAILEQSLDLVKHAPVGIYEIDLYGPRFKSVNDYMCLATGYTRDELLAINPYDLLDNESASLFRERIRKQLSGEEIDDTVEYTGRAKDGREMCWLLKVAFTYSNGKPLGAIVVGHDITDRRQAEGALRESDARYRELVENSNSIILRSDRNGNITYLNEFGQQFFGYSEAEIIGRNAVGIIIPAKDSADRDLRVMMDDLLRHPEEYRTNTNENMCKDGRFVWVSWTNKAIYDSAGNMTGLLC
ncbi:MAG TPA: PAS domain-containing protein, partial [Methanocella sp.]|nr:PAS domain-containing protein [Methanocella sp.]